MVEAKEAASKMFWNEASTAEKDPRESESTS
jgi:hypothetical protein